MTGMFVGAVPYKWVDSVLSMLEKERAAWSDNPTFRTLPDDSGDGLTTILMDNGGRATGRDVMTLIQGFSYGISAHEKPP